jgi:hypothetical protein
MTYFNTWSAFSKLELLNFLRVNQFSGFSGSSTSLIIALDPIKRNNKLCSSVLIAAAIPE